MRKKVIMGLMLLTPTVCCSSEEVVYNVNGPVEYIDELQDLDYTLDSFINPICAIINDFLRDTSIEEYMEYDEYVLALHADFIFDILAFIRTLEPELALKHARVVERFNA